MITDLHDRLTALFDDVAARVSVEPEPFRATPLALRRWDGRRSGRVAAALVSLVGLAVMATLAIRHEIGRSSPTGTDRTSRPDATPPLLFSGPAQHIEWTVLEPGSSIGRAGVFSIAAGPNGFVASGQGYDHLADGQGRVWFSPDGEHWNEPDPSRFRHQTMYAVAATSRAYFVYASPTPPTEGSPPQPSQLYTSPDGQAWAPIGDPLVNAGNLFSVGDILVRSGTFDSTLETSTNGIDWTVAHLDGLTGLYVDSGGVLTGGRVYVRAVARDGSATVWSSTDNRQWAEIPTSPPVGVLTATDRALVSMSALNGPECESPSIAATDDPTERSRWLCDMKPAAAVLDVSTDRWTEMVPLGVPTPTLPGLVAFGNQLIATLVDPGGFIYLLSSRDGRTWERVSVTVPPDPSDRRSGPQPAWVEAHDSTTIVIPAPVNGVGEQGHLIVGHIAPVG